MPVTVRYSGGPRNGKKNVLQNYDDAPHVLSVTEKEAKAANMLPGSYTYRRHQGDPALYMWQ